MTAILTAGGLAGCSQLRHGFSTLEAGAMRRDGAAGPHTAERLAFVAELGLDPGRVTIAGAVHGAAVARVDEPVALMAGVDALVCAVPGVALLVTFADCLPLVLHDPRRRAVALAHAGWRGTAAGVAQAAVDALTREFGTAPEDLVAGFGPGICGRCYQVGEEVARQFEARFSSPDGTGRFRLDLAAANAAALVEAGVRPAAISAPAWCTYEDSNIASHRRDADGRRGIAVAGLM